MKKTAQTILILVLSLLSSQVMAAWTEIEKFEDSTRVFADKASARRNGDTAEILHLVRWGEPQIDPGQPAYRSTIVRTSYDCTAKLERYLGSTSYADPMGSGATIISDNDEAESWYSISDGSMEEKLWKLACSSK
jgi:hypothetical protein